MDLALAVSSTIFIALLVLCFLKARSNLPPGDHFSYNFSGIATSPYGELWRNTRKLCTMELFTAKCIDSFSWVRRDELSRALEGILKAHGDGKPVEGDVKANLMVFLMLQMPRRC
ncbi:hypothetical protein SELMODRAFT_409747 [Selaginella moellendorffii]|uniref:Uncharacterized protein CYP797B15 n=1 Tax=Selaginella moellendorffii TaxID=88036 RepID=D8RCB5_SELML|nr:hypothetical protein SELMODRAFT_409747 [Selaginella moellendorffii]